MGPLIVELILSADGLLLHDAYGRHEPSPIRRAETDLAVTESRDSQGGLRDMCFLSSRAQGQSNPNLLAASDALTHLSSFAQPRASILRLNETLYEDNLCKKSTMI